MSLLKPEVESLLDLRSKRLNSYSYKLQEAGAFGYDVSFLGDMEVIEGEMSVRFPFADGQRRDGVGDLLEVGGIDTSRHRLNPIVCFDHAKTVSLPIGLAEDPNTKEYTVVCDPITQQATVKAFIYQRTDGSDYEHALFCEQLFDLMVKKYIRAGSIGYSIIDATPIPADYEKGIPKGLHLKKVLMLEASAVVLPANQDTVRKALAMPKVCGKPLSPMLVKSLSPYAGEVKAQVSVPLNSNLSETKVPPAKWEPGVGAKNQPSDSIDPDKARQILHDGEVNGHPLTDKQRRMFGAASNKILKLRQKYRKQGNPVVTDTKQLRLVTDTKALPPKDEDEAVDRAAGGTAPGAANGEVDAKAPTETPAPAPVEAQPTAETTPTDPMDNQLDTTLPNPDESVPQEGMEGSTEPPLEKLSAQVIRRMHKDILLLMEDYDQFHALLENEEVADFLMADLRAMEEKLNALEDLFAKHHPDLPHIEGAMPRPQPQEGMDNSMPGENPAENPLEAGEETDSEMESNTDAIPADSGDEDIKEEPSGDEAIEGMKKGKKTTPKEQEQEKKTPPNKEKEEKSMISPKVKSKCMCGTKDCTCGMKGKDSDKDKGKKDKKEPEGGEQEELKEDQPKEDPEQEDIAESKVGMKKRKSLADKLEDYEKDMVKDAHSYLGELANTSDFGDEHRMKSYHYHKTMHAISHLKKTLDDAPDMNNGVGEGDDLDQKSIPGDHQWMQEEAMEQIHKHRKCCGDASNYFLRLSREKAFGDPHREEALMYQKAMDSIINGKDDEEMESPEQSQSEIDGTEEMPVGSVEDKEVDEREFHKAMKDMEEINEMLNQLRNSYSLN